MADPKTYMDGGHGTPNSFLWLYRNGALEVHKTGSRTHEKLWGRKAMDYWRGRYDDQTGEVSVAKPAKYLMSQRGPPQYLIDALEAEFGGDIKIYGFNPTRRLN